MWRVAVVTSDEGWAAYAAEQERHAETTALVSRVRALVESWPHGDNGQDYRAAVTQCRAAVLAALDGGADA